MRYFAMIDRGDQAEPPPATFAGLPLVANRSAILQSGKDAAWSYASAQDFWRLFSKASELAQKAHCEIVLYAPATALIKNRSVDLSVACELAIRGYFAVLGDGETGAWRAEAGAPLHAYGKKIKRLATADKLPKGVPISPILAFAASVWLNLDNNLGNSIGDQADLPWAWLGAMPERLALAGW